MDIVLRQHSVTGEVMPGGAIKSSCKANVIKPSPNVVTVLRLNAPFACFYPNFASPEECDHIVALAQGKLAPSRIGGGGECEERKEGRTSSSAPLEKGEDEVVARLEERAAYLSGLPIDNIERLQVVHYKNHQLYDAHWDSFGPHNPQEQQIALKHGYNRVISFLLYLSGPDECLHPPSDQHYGPLNGCTLFPLLNAAVSPVKGGAICWTNTDDNLLVYDAALHQGLPVCCGEKYALNIWIHNRDLWNFGDAMAEMRLVVRVVVSLVVCTSLLLPSCVESSGIVFCDHHFCHVRCASLCSRDVPALRTPQERATNEERKRQM